LSLLIVKDLRKSYSQRTLFAGASMQIDPGEKVGLVGPNGQGKTTLLLMIASLERPDSGSITLRKGARLGHVAQQPPFAPGQSVRAYVSEGLRFLHELEEELIGVTAAMSSAAEADLPGFLKRQQELNERLEALGGWQTERRVETVLGGLGLGESFWDREARTLSGGEKSRAALARELVSGHDLLLLDEPTNHLDLEGIEWIEAWLAEVQSACLIVSHDRRILERAVGSIVELEQGKLRRYPGAYEKYVALREERYASELRAWQVQQELIAREEAFIRRHMGSQRTAEARGRQKKLANLARLEKPSHDVRKPAIRPPSTERGGELVLEATDLAVGHDRKAPILAGIRLRLGRGQRVGIVGANGTGKTTLLKTLAGRLDPLGGELRTGHRAVCGYFDQEAGRSVGPDTPFAWIRRSFPQLSDLEVRSHLARFLFRGDAVEADCESLSGGERARLALARLLLESPSWLALDEPTNHLDLPSRTALEEMLGEFQGTLVCISHDRAFLDGLCLEIWEVAGGAVSVFPGNYSQWREAKLERGARRAAAAQEEKAPARPNKAKPASSSSGRIRNPFLFEKLEQRIIDLEEELRRLNEGLASEAVYLNPARLKETQLRIAEVEDALGSANAEWESWS
jgi:ATP-binding cassette subfamily F protein 3